MKQKHIVKAAHVARWHASPEVTKTETVGTHALIVAKLMLLYWPDTSRTALIEAMQHDDAEVITGDLPGPAKERFSQSLRGCWDEFEQAARDKLGLGDANITQIEAARLQFCDRLAGYLHVKTFSPWLLDQAEWVSARGWLDLRRQELGAEGVECERRC